MKHVIQRIKVNIMHLKIVPVMQIIVIAKNYHKKQ